MGVKCDSSDSIRVQPLKLSTLTKAKNQEKVNSLCSGDRLLSLKNQEAIANRYEAIQFDHSHGSTKNFILGQCHKRRVVDNVSVLTCRCQPAIRVSTQSDFNF